MKALGIDYNVFRENNPALVMCSITPFGLSGPHKDYSAYELNIAHGGGWAWLSPGASDLPNLPPLKAFGHQAEFQAGVVAAMVAATAYACAVETGVGEHADISVQEVVASFLEQNFVHYTYAGTVASRLGRRIVYPWGMYQCRDGQIFLVTVEEDQWRRLVELMGSPEWATWEIFSYRFKRAEHWYALKGFIDEWVKDWRVDDLFRACQERRICACPVSTMSTLAAEEQLHERGFFVEVEHPRVGKTVHLGAPYRLARPWWAIRRRAPLLGDHTLEVLKMVERLGADAAPRKNLALQERHPRRPLEGVRVADFSWAWAGPFCAMQLAHLGAEVIKIESRHRIDLGRVIPVYPTGIDPGVNRSGYFNQWNQGKKSVTLNLHEPEAITIARKIVAKSDVVVDNFATGVMERLGLGYEELRELRPDLIVASISGFGRTGPLRSYMGYGPAIVVMSGLASLTGYGGGGPAEVGISYGDPNGGIHAAVAICAALAARKRTGEGQYIDLSLLEAMMALLPEGWMEYALNRREPARTANRDSLMAPHNCFRCAGDDEWVTIACGSDDEWRRLCAAMGRPELAGEPRFSTAQARKRHEDELEKFLGDWASLYTKWQITELLQSAGVAALPSMSSKDLAEDAHLNDRGFFARLPHPEVGVRTHAGIPWRLAHGSNGVRSPAPLLGQHTDYVMRAWVMDSARTEHAPLLGQHTDYVMSELWGYSKADIERLTELQVLS